MREPAQETVPRGEVGRCGASGRRCFCPENLRCECRRKAGRELVLQREQIVDVAVVAAGPQLRAILGRDQLGYDAHLRSGTPHRALDQIGCVDLACDQARAQLPALEGKGRAAAQHPVERLQRQRVDQVFRQPIREIIIRFVGKIDERQYADNGGLVLRRQIGEVRPGGSIGLPGPDVDGLADVFQVLAAGADQNGADVFARFEIGFFGDRNAALGRRRFEANRDVDVVAEHLVLVGDHVAHVDAHAEFHDPVCGEQGVALGHQLLHLDRGLDRPDHAGKFQQEAVAGVFDDASAMVEDDRENRGAVSLEGGMGARLVGSHHARVAGDVSAEDGGQASVH
ncbi:hypothetical protein ES703_55852 [subsurface metagenome]